MVSPPGSRTPAMTREALLDAATELFASAGYDGTTVDAISSRARVNKAMISYHFGGKHGLYTAILERDFGWTLARLSELDAEPRPAEAKLARFVAIFGELHRRRPGLSALMLREAMSGGLHLDPAVVPKLRSIFASVQGIVAQGIDEGVFRKVDPLSTYHIVVGSLAFYFAARPLGERLIAEGIVPFAAPTPDEFVAHVQDLLARGLRRD